LSHHCTAARRDLPSFPTRRSSDLGDVAIALCHLADRAKLKLTVTGCDISQTALDYARSQASRAGVDVRWIARNVLIDGIDQDYRSEEHTSELQSRENLVCRLLLEK